MFEKDSFPHIDFVRIEKEGNKRGFVEIRDFKGVWQKHDFEGSMPFSNPSGQLASPYSSEIETGSDRESWLAKVLRVLIKQNRSNRFPTRFRDANNVAWKVDKTALPRLVASGRFRFIDNQKYIESTQVDEDVPQETHQTSDERLRSYYRRLQRPEQAKFRKHLLDRHSVCCVSGCQTPSMLEAAHIVPVADGGFDEPSNGVLLRADLHRLFDNHLMAFDPDTGEVTFSNQVHSDDQVKPTERILNPRRFAMRWEAFNKFCSNK